MEFGRSLLVAKNADGSKGGSKPKKPQRLGSSSKGIPGKSAGGDRKSSSGGSAVKGLAGKAAKAAIASKSGQGSTPIVSPGTSDRYKRKRVSKGKSAEKNVVSKAADTAAATAAGAALTASTGLPPAIANKIAALGVRNKKKLIAYTLLSSFFPLITISLVILIVFSAISSSFPTFGIDPSSQAKSQISSSYLAVYQEAGTNNEVPWPILAAIGYTTTQNGKNDPYTTTSTIKNFPEVSPPIVPVPGTPGDGVGPMLIDSNVVSLLTHGNPQNASDSINAIAGLLYKAGRDVAKSNKISYTTMYTGSLSDNAKYWQQAIAKLPISIGDNCAPPQATTASTGTSSAADMATTIEYVFSCEVSTAKSISLGVGYGVNIPPISAPNQLIAEALQVSWSYSKYGTVGGNCNPFPPPVNTSGGGVTNDCNSAAPGDITTSQVNNIRTTAQNVIAASTSSTSALGANVWSAVPGALGKIPAANDPVVPTTPKGTTPPPIVSASNGWPTAVPPTQACEDSLAHNLALATPSSNGIGMTEPEGPFYPSGMLAKLPPSDPSLAAAWNASPLESLRNNPVCQIPSASPSGVSTIIDEPTWQLIVLKAANEELAQEWVSIGAQSPTQNISGLIEYLTYSLTAAGSLAVSPVTPVWGQTSSLQRQSNPVVGMSIPISGTADGGKQIIPLIPIQIGTSGFGSDVMNLAQGYDNRVSNCSGSASAGGTLSGPMTEAVWAGLVLQDAKLPVTQVNIDNYIRWINAEDPWQAWWNPGHNNPQNVNASNSGSDVLTNLVVAAQVTASVINNGLYSDIVDALKKSAPITVFEVAVYKSPWASSNYGVSPWATGSNVDPNRDVHYFEHIPIPPPVVAPPDAIGGSSPSSITLVSSSCTTSSTGASDGSKGAAAVAAAETQIGVPYVWGASTPKSSTSQGAFDCSGLTMWAWGKAGVNLPHYSGSQMAASTPVNRNNLKPGDLLFYGPGGGEHVAMYIGNDTMIEAPHTGAWVHNTPVRTDFVGAARPGG